MEFGSIISAPDITPVKKSDAQYTYSFISWQGYTEGMQATGTHTFYAAYMPNLRYYNITFNVDGLPYSSSNLPYGSDIKSPSENPIKEDTAEFKYIFLKWDGYYSDQKVIGNRTYNAVFTTLTREYSVVFSNDDTIVQFQTLKYGSLIESTGVVTKDSTAKYDYIFNGWSGFSEGMLVTDTVVFYAEYTESLRSYTITWLYEDGTSIEVDEEVPYGSMPTYDGKLPTKESEAQYSYFFRGWSPSVSSVTGNVAYIAVFEKILNTYSITWTDDEGNILEINKNVSYGSMPSFNGATPVKESTAEYHYTFSGWSPVVKTVSCDMSYSAIFTASLNTYSVTWKDSAGLVLQYDESVPYGTVPEYNGSIPFKLSDNQYMYTFSGWDPVVSPITSNKIYTAQFAESLRTYSVTWKTEDGIILKIDTDLDYGTIPVYNNPTPTKESTAQYDYTFRCWSPAIVGVTGDDTYVAMFDSYLRCYNVIWKNYDGTVLNTSVVHYGVTPSYSGVTPIKPDNDSLTYTFSGWAPDIVPVTSDAVYVALYSESRSEYSVIWTNEDGSILSIDYNVEYGSVPVFVGSTPVKKSTEQYRYLFVGWSPAIVPVTENTVYVATFSQTLVEYAIVWKNFDGSILEEDSAPYGSSPRFDGVLPVKASTAQYTYTFSGWDSELEAVKSDKTYTATFASSVNTYTVSWINGDEILYTSALEYGMLPSFNGAVPVKDSDGVYSYSFAGWSPEVINVTGNAEYHATFIPSILSYTVIWKDDSGNVIGIDYDMKYGQTPSFDETKISKEPSAQYTYVFSGWYPEIAPIKGNITYVAMFESVVNSYSVIWKNYDDTVLETDTEKFGTTPMYDGLTPIRESNAQYTYSFIGWDSELSSISCDVVYTAKFDRIVNTYCVSWVDGDSVLYSVILPYGSMPVYNGNVPARESTLEYAYSFVGWSSEIVPVTCDVTYNAVFSASKIGYNITWIDEDGKVISVNYGVEYGARPVFSGSSPEKGSDSQYTYAFAGWYPEVAKVAGDAIYKATYTSSLNEYRIVWKNFDGSILEEDSAPYGSSPRFDGVLPVKASTAQYTYTFSGWDSELEAVKSDKTYTATFASSVNTYTVSWINGDEILYTSALEYGMLPSFNGAVPVKDSDGVYSYSFAGWSPEVINVTGNAEYHATFTSSKLLYVVTWKNDDGSILEVDHDVTYGAVPVYDGTAPTKKSDSKYTYMFSGWSPSMSAVTGDVTYTAIYSKTFVNYTVAWLNEDGAVILIDSTAHYGDVITYSGDTPTKEPSSYFEYTFLRWNGFLEGMLVTENITFTAVFEDRQVFYPITFIQYNGEKTTLLYKHGDSYVEEPDAYYGTPAGCIAYWEPYYLNEDLDNTVHVIVESYLDYGYIDAPVQKTDVGIDSSIRNQILAVTGINSNINKLHQHQGLNLEIQIPNTTLDGRTIDAILRISDDSVSKIVFGENIRYISEGAFENCKSLSGFEVTGGSYYKSLNGALLTYSGESLVCLPSVGESYTIPDTVKEILNAAIQGSVSVIYLDSNKGMIMFANGANISGNDIELRTLNETTELSFNSLMTNNESVSLDIIPHDLYGDQSGDMIYIVMIVAGIAILVQFIAAYRPNILGNKHTWTFIAPLSIVAFSMFVYSIVETVGHDTDVYFTGLVGIWFVAGILSTVVTLVVYITTNRFRNESFVNRKWRTATLMSSVISIIGAVMIILASFGNIARISDVMAPQLIVLSVMIILANVLAVMASKKIFAEVKYSQEHFTINKE